MSQQPNQQPVTQPVPQPWAIWQKLTALIAALVTMVPLIGLAGAGASQLMELGKNQSTVEMQARLISDLQAEKKSLSDKAEQLQSKSHDLELKLSNSEANLAIASQQLTQLSKDLGEYKAVATELDQRAKATDPCLSIQGIIANLEKQLAVDQAWSHSLIGARRDEAMIQLEKHQQSLRSCLSRSS